ncbi:hypothetical protein E8E13_000505 [Curvularia kusanoi]|uniref:Uncharacterized protein n=1 Tax=Curvularia kusanoi TaxID=90978 RepID=A0A9P4T4Y5_CURKU|nr:hypothetical protein E8E13_000505 [Curvularia kusanoi]
MLERIRDAGATYPTEPWDLDPPFELTVFDDKTKFEGADPHTVREAFRKWVADDLPPRVRRPDMYGGVDKIRANIENSTVPELWHYAQRPLHPWYWATPRWSFCLLVDDFCLRSLEDPKNIPVVKLVNLRYFKDRCGNIAEGWEDGETADDPYEDVGWQYMHITDYGACYGALSDPTNWDDEVWYHRPAKGDYPLAIDF